MTKTVSAAAVIARFNKGEINFGDLGECEVDGEVTLGHITLGSMVNLGDLRFSTLNCGNAIFASEFYCDNARIGEFRAGKAQFQLFDLESSVIEAFSGEEAEFGTFGCCEGTVKTFSPGKATFRKVYAEQNPALAWVIQQHIQSGVQFDIEHAPPWMKRR